jgi:hypothetical protein
MTRASAVGAMLTVAVLMTSGAAIASAAPHEEGDLRLAQAIAAPNDRQSNEPPRAPHATPEGKPSAPPRNATSGSNGVIHPPATGDHNVVTPPPDAGAKTMSIIPPPGTAGGNPEVQPK